MNSYTVSWFEEDGGRVMVGFEAAGREEAREKAAEILERETGLDLRQLEDDIVQMIAVLSEDKHEHHEPADTP